MCCRIHRVQVVTHGRERLLVQVTADALDKAGMAHAKAK
jgi:hypothetical protein